MIREKTIFRNMLFGAALLVACASAASLSSCTEKDLSGDVDVESSDVEIRFSASVTDSHGSAVRSGGAGFAINGSAAAYGEEIPLGDSGLCLTVNASENLSNPFDRTSTRASIATGFGAEAGDGIYDRFSVVEMDYIGNSWEDAKDAGTVYSYRSGKSYSFYMDDVTNQGGVWTFVESHYWKAGIDGITFYGVAPSDHGDWSWSYVGYDGEDPVYDALFDDLEFCEFEDIDIEEYGASLDPFTMVLGYHDTEIDEENDNVFDWAPGGYEEDILVASTEGVSRAKAGEAVSMNFKHILTAVQFKYGSMPEGTVVHSVEMDGIEYKGIYNVTTGNWDHGEGEATYLINLDEYLEDGVPENPVEGDDILGGSYTLMMMPQEFEEVPLTIVCSLPDEPETVELTATLSGSWLPGQLVTYTISYTPDGGGRIDIIPYLTDENFKAYCIENYSSDGEHVWYPEETEGVTTMDFINSTSQYTNITDFTGIYWFENLEYFTSRTAETLDLSQNLELSYIFLGGTSSGEHGASITSLDLSKNTKLDSIVMTSFEYCLQLKEINLPSSCTAIGPDAFMECGNLETVTGWESLTKIGFAAFYECTNLKSATLAEGLESIGWWAFYRCTNLAMDVVFPSTLKSIGDQAFYQAGVTSFAADDEIEQHVVSGELELGTGVFEGCTSLTSAVFPDGWTTIRESWFSGCTSLTSITLPESVTTIEKQAFANTGLPTIGLPAGLTTLGYGAFQNCTSLTEITIPSGVTLIDGYTFNNCGALTYIDLPAITSIGNYAFYNCYQLATMILRATNVPEVGGTRALDFDYSHTFNHATHTLYVPAASVDAYEAAWGAEGTNTYAAGKFANILTIENDLDTTEP